MKTKNWKKIRGEEKAKKKKSGNLTKWIDGIYVCEMIKKKHWITNKRIIPSFFFIFKRRNQHDDIRFIPSNGSVNTCYTGLLGKY